MEKRSDARVKNEEKMIRAWESGIRKSFSLIQEVQQCVFFSRVRCWLLIERLCMHGGTTSLLYYTCSSLTLSLITSLFSVYIIYQISNADDCSIAAIRISHMILHGGVLANTAMHLRRLASLNYSTQSPTRAFSIFSISSKYFLLPS